MKTTFASIALFVAGALAQFTINTPANVVECQPTLISWSGGAPPYYLSILPGGSPTAAALEDLGQQNSTSVTWICNIQAGVSLGLTLRDSTGLTAQSAPFTVNPGSSIACLNTTSLAPGPTAATSPAASSATVPAGATTAKATASTSTSPSASPSTGAASSNVALGGFAGVIGAAVAALLL
ncbi:hypothetical protein PAXRUDRAFT_832173 [Paxillus rubicundulus Ve08.2h10]|uniref:Uncharacterized protein n=1 Tax=Paxillus rubicundulus Ve08.2h10 TaxID=930991 RepID=A0A0D0DRW5_9AGAM|nr:hypothetical protein PAXRUDRAFT_832173 [Paxillus rubicundulus Ve08.2h10]